MNRLEEALHRVCGELDGLGARWALVGGLAVSVRAEPRTTMDIDLAVAVVSDAEAERIVRELTGRGYRFVHDGVVEQAATDRLAMVRLTSPGSGDEPGVTTDLLFASSGIEPEIVARAERLEALPGLRLPIATRGHLIALKILAGRDQDLADARSLLAEADEGDLGQAREAADLISKRGYHRGKDLPVELAKFVRAGSASEPRTRE